MHNRLGSRREFGVRLELSARECDRSVMTGVRGTEVGEGGEAKYERAL